LTRVRLFFARSPLKNSDLNKAASHAERKIWVAAMPGVVVVVVVIIIIIIIIIIITTTTTITITIIITITITIIIIIIKTLFKES